MKFVNKLRIFFCFLTFICLIIFMMICLQMIVSYIILFTENRNPKESFLLVKVIAVTIIPVFPGILLFMKEIYKKYQNFLYAKKEQKNRFIYV